RKCPRTSKGPSWSSSSRGCANTDRNRFGSVSRPGSPPPGFPRRRADTPGTGPPPGTSGGGRHTLRASTSVGLAGLDGELDHEPATLLQPGLEPVLRARQRRGRAPAKRPRGRLREDGLQESRLVSPRGRGAGATRRRVAEG